MKLLRNTFLTISLSLAITLVISGFPARASADQEVIATLGGKPITREQVEERAANRLYRLRWEIYDTLSKEAAELADERLLQEEANRRKLSVEELLRVEVEEKMVPPTDEQVEAYILENKIAEKPGPDLRSRIAAYLMDRERIQRRLDYLSNLRNGAAYQFLVEPPPRPRIQVSIDDDPSRGTPDAPVTIVHFASFSCEICSESAQKIERLMEEFPGRIRWVHRDFLNIFDERALRAAEAGEAAHAAGLFWQYHDYIYSLSGDFDQEDLGKIMEEAGGDAALYEEAHQKAMYIPEIKHDIEDGVKAGVTSVPVVFVNGRYFSGTFGYEKLRGIVEEELAAAEKESEKQATSSP